MAIAALMLLALKVANTGVTGSDQSYKFYAKFDNIGGLKAAFASQSRWCCGWVA